jgi:hypothetical protein
MISLLSLSQRGSDELLSHSPMVTTNGGGSMSPTQTEVNNDAKKVRRLLFITLRRLRAFRGLHAA